jgi:hypothetical protein
LLYALDDHVWGMKIIALEEFIDFATLNTEKQFSKLKSHELSRKGRPEGQKKVTRGEEVNVSQSKLLKGIWTMLQI